MMSGNIGSGLGPGSGGALNNSQSMSNAIDKENKNLAMRIKKCPIFKQYKQQYSSNLNYKQ